MDVLRQWTARGKHRFPADTDYGTSDESGSGDESGANDESGVGDESCASGDGGVDIE